MITNPPDSLSLETMWKAVWKTIRQLNNQIFHVHFTDTSYEVRSCFRYEECSGKTQHHVGETKQRCPRIPQILKLVSQLNVLKMAPRPLSWWIRLKSLWNARSYCKMRTIWHWIIFVKSKFCWAVKSTSTIVFPEDPLYSFDHCSRTSYIVKKFKFAECGVRNRATDTLTRTIWVAPMEVCCSCFASHSVSNPIHFSRRLFLCPTCK